LLKEYTAQLQTQLLLSVVALRADQIHYVHVSVRPGFKSRRKQQRHKKDFQIFTVNFQFSACNLQGIFENKFH
jgi:hypothetical protein